MEVVYFVSPPGYAAGMLNRRTLLQMLGLAAGAATIPQVLPGGDLPPVVEAAVTRPWDVFPIVGQVACGIDPASETGDYSRIVNLVFGSDERWHVWAETMEDYDRITGGLLRSGDGLGFEGLKVSK